MILIIGPCHKKKSKDGGMFPAFAEESRSGKFLRAIVRSAGVEPGVVFDNILATTVVNEKGQEVIPSVKELAAGLKDRRGWLEAEVIIGLGGAVQMAFDRVRQDDIAGKQMHFVEHPAYILRRPAQERAAYAAKVEALLRGARTSGPSRQP
jgi:hypothetical protein